MSSSIVDSGSPHAQSGGKKGDRKIPKRRRSFNWMMRARATTETSTTSSSTGTSSRSNSTTEQPSSKAPATASANNHNTPNMVDPEKIVSRSFPPVGTRSEPNGVSLSSTSHQQHQIQTTLSSSRIKANAQQPPPSPARKPNVIKQLAISSSDPSAKSSPASNHRGYATPSGKTTKTVSARNMTRSRSPRLGFSKKGLFSGKSMLNRDNSPTRRQPTDGPAIVVVPAVKLGERIPNQRVFENKSPVADTTYAQQQKLLHQVKTGGDTAVFFSPGQSRVISSPRTRYRFPGSSSRGDSSVRALTSIPTSTSPKAKKTKMTPKKNSTQSTESGSGSGSGMMSKSVDTSASATATVATAQAKEYNNGPSLISRTDTIVRMPHMRQASPRLATRVKQKTAFGRAVSPKPKTKTRQKLPQGNNTLKRSKTPVRKTGHAANTSTKTILRTTSDEMDPLPAAPLTPTPTPTPSVMPSRSNSFVSHAAAAAVALANEGNNTALSASSESHKQLLSFVLMAALDLLEEKSNWEAQALEEYRKICPDFPPRNEVIMTGTLKKAREGQFLHWKPKFVAISPGRLTYLGQDESQLARMFALSSHNTAHGYNHNTDGNPTDGRFAQATNHNHSNLQHSFSSARTLKKTGAANQPSSPGSKESHKRGRRFHTQHNNAGPDYQHLGGVFDHHSHHTLSRDGKRKHKHREVKARPAKHIELRHGSVKCHAVPKRSNNDAGKFVFEITATENGKRTTRLFMANSEEERAGWIHAIHTAMCPEVLASAGGDTRAAAQCSEVKSAVGGAQDRIDYLQSLCKEFHIDVQQAALAANILMNSQTLELNSDTIIQQNAKKRGEEEEEEEPRNDMQGGNGYISSGGPNGSFVDDGCEEGGVVFGLLTEDADGDDYETSSVVTVDEDLENTEEEGVDCGSGVDCLGTPLKHSAKNGMRRSSIGSSSSTPALSASNSAIAAASRRQRTGSVDESASAVVAMYPNSIRNEQKFQRRGAGLEGSWSAIRRGREGGEGKANNKQWQGPSRLCGSHVLVIPMEWVHTQFKRARGDVDPSMAQVFKDMQRDAVEINGRLFRGQEQESGGRGETGCSTSPIRLLGRMGARNINIAPLLPTTPVPAGTSVAELISALAMEIQQCGEEVGITEAQALAFSREVLLACNRTQSGGNTYEAVNLVLGNNDLVLITPDSAHAEPLKISVTSDEGEDDFDFEDIVSTLNSPLQTSRSVSASKTSQFDWEASVPFSTSTVAPRPATAGSVLGDSTSASRQRQPVLFSGTNSSHVNNRSANIDDLCLSDDPGETLSSRAGVGRNKLSNSSPSIQRPDLPKSVRKHLRTSSEPLSALFAHVNLSTRGHSSSTSKNTNVNANTTTGAIGTNDSAGYYKNKANNSNISLSSHGTGIVYENPPSLDGHIGDSDNNNYNNNSEVNSLFGAATEGELDINKRTSRKASMSSVGSQQSNSFVSNQGVRIAGPRVSVQVTMVYRICDMEMAGENGDGVLGYVKAIYRRSFVLSGQASVALGQGTVDLGVTISETGAELLNEENRNSDGVDGDLCNPLVNLNGLESLWQGSSRTNETIPTSASMSDLQKRAAAGSECESVRRMSNTSVTSAPPVAPLFDCN